MEDNISTGKNKETSVTLAVPGSAHLLSEALLLCRKKRVFKLKNFKAVIGPTRLYPHIRVGITRTMEGTQGKQIYTSIMIFPSLSITLVNSETCSENIKRVVDCTYQHHFVAYGHILFGWEEGRAII